MAAGDESAERSQLPTGSLALTPILSQVDVELPALIAAEEALTRAILRSCNFPRSEQELLLAVAANEWPGAVAQLALLLPEVHARHNDGALEKFGSKLARYGPWCGKHDCDELIAAGCTESDIITASAIVALGNFRCTLAAGLLPWSRGEAPASAQSRTELPPWRETEWPFIVPKSASLNDLDASFAQIRGLFGFVPNIIQLQSYLPELVAAEVQLIEASLGSDDHLSQVQKHSIAICLSAANFSNYLVALHGELLSLIGMTPQETTALLDDAGGTSTPPANRLLCSETRTLRIVPAGRQLPIDHKALREAGLTKEQIAEAVMAAALANFLSTVQFALGALPDFAPVRTFSVKDLYLSPDETRPSQNEIVREDPDLEFIAKVRRGETEAFEHLVRSHTRRVFRTLFGLLGNAEEARDATQDTFLKAFEHIGNFEGRSKFSTWLTSIAVNTGTEILRRRRPVESLEVEDDEHGFRPRQVRSWVDNPEEALAKSQLNEVVRNGVLRLPEKYRVALLLRDINQLSTEDTAEALGLTLSATKARILRGRLMLRETLAPRFSKAEGGRHV